MNADSAARAQSGGPGFNREVLQRLAAIEERLAAGDKRFDAMDRHVTDCAEKKAALQVAVAALSGQMTGIRNLILGVMALLGSAMVAVAIALT